MQFDVTSWKNVTRLFDFVPPKDKLFGPFKSQVSLTEKQPPQSKYKNEAQIEEISQITTRESN